MSPTGFAISRWRAIAVACFGVQLLLMSQALGWYYSGQTKEQWRESASFVLGQPDCMEGPIYVFGDTDEMRAYLLRLRSNRIRHADDHILNGCRLPLVK